MAMQCTSSAHESNTRNRTPPAAVHFAHHWCKISALLHHYGAGWLHNVA